MTRSNAVMHRDFNRDYPAIDRARGIYVYDTAGKEYVDAASGAVVVNIGYGVDEVVDAMAAQARRTPYTYLNDFTSEVQDELADYVIGLAPGMRRVFFCSGGSEGIEIAIKTARDYHLQIGNPSRYKIISRWQAYHGSTLGALALTGRPRMRTPYEPYLMKSPKVSPPHPYRCVYCRERGACTLACADELERTIRREGAETVAAFICEPVVGTSLAALVSPPGYLAHIRDVCDRYGVLLIVDEIMSGFGRTGRTFAIEHWSVVPDLMVIGKGIASGYAPLGAVLFGDKVAAAYEEGDRAFGHGHTYSANPMALAAALAVQRYAERNGLTAQCAERGRYLGERLKRFIDLPIVGEVRGLGLMHGLELVADRDTGSPFDPGAAVGQRVYRKAFERGLIVRPGVQGSADGIAGDHLLVTPPLIVTEAEIDRIVAELEVVLTAVQAELDEPGAKTGSRSPCPPAGALSAQQAKAVLGGPPGGVDVGKRSDVLAGH